MDAVEFMKEYKRILKKYCPPDDGSYACPSDCPLYQQVCTLDSSHIDYVIFRQLVNTVEDWSKKNPQKTMLQDFFEKFPNFKKDINGTPIGCPDDYGYEEESICGLVCDQCSECWNRCIKE